jgi:Na+-translocating ferredoxin:NAD+ oxidoreductase subunit G
MDARDGDKHPGVLRTLLLVGVVASAAALLVTTSHEVSHERIAENQRVRLQSNLNTVLPTELHDNDLSATRLQVTDRERLGSAEPVDVYIATMRGVPVAALFASIAPDGYNAPIRLLIGVFADGSVSGVRVLSHRETPGLGDPIEIEKSDWITRFDGRTLDDPARELWAVRRDEGEFDALTGATVTSRAVVRAVRNTLIFFEENRDELFAAGTALLGTEDEHGD